VEVGQQQFYSSIANVYEYIFPVKSEQIELVKSEFGSVEEFIFLDAGCSTGQLAGSLCQSGALGIGVDLNPDMIRRANENYRSVDLVFKEMDMLRLKSGFPAEYFDAVICFGNTLVHLESITQIRDFLQQGVHLLKTNGVLFLQILNYSHILSRKIQELSLIDNDKIRFERFYQLPSSNHPKINFMTKLTVKSEGAIVENTTNLIPIQKNELERILQLVGFSEIRFYSNFEKKPYTENQLQLVVVARK
jgi:2-polyprenyl-3-methyl-5-hydroxy-6-metoxy-1,4-benzoquinol methylase